MTTVESNDVWLHEKPRDWQRSRIRNVVALSPSYSATAPASDEPCTVVPMELLSGDGAIDASNQQPLDGVTSGLTLFEAGDVLFAKITPCMENGKGAFVRELPTRYAFGSTEFLVLRPSKKIDGAFLYYATFNPIYRAYAAENMVGAAGQKRVSSRFVKDTRLFLPPLPEQRLIASFLDASCAAIDAAVAAKRRQLEILDALRKTNIHYAVTCGLSDKVEFKDSEVEWLGKIPFNWHIKRIKDIVDLKSGDAITSDSIAPIGNYPVFGGNGLRGYTNSYTHNGYYVLIGRQGALCGNINYAEGKFWASEHAVVAITLKKHDTFWFGELIRVMNLNQYSNAAAQPGLAVERIKFLQIPIPPYEEQVQISSWLKNMIIKNEEMVSILRKQISTLIAYRKSLIHECVTGQRRITEADVRRVQNKRSPT